MDENPGYRSLDDGQIDNHAFERWLRNADQSDVTILTDLLRGLRGGYGRDSDLPFQYVTRLIADGEKRAEIVQLLGARIARLLDGFSGVISSLEQQAPSIEGAVDAHVRRESLAFNVLMLCARLPCPSKLAKPLQRIHALFSPVDDWQPAEERGWPIRRQFQGIAIVDALRAAMIRNQDKASSSLMTWHEMIRHDGSKSINGDIFSGLDGLLHLQRKDSEVLHEIERCAPYIATHIKRRNTDFGCQLEDFNDLIHMMGSVRPPEFLWRDRCSQIPQLQCWTTVPVSSASEAEPRRRDSMHMSFSHRRGLQLTQVTQARRFECSCLLGELQTSELAVEFPETEQSYARLARIHEVASNQGADL